MPKTQFILQWLRPIEYTPAPELPREVYRFIKYFASLDLHTEIM